MLAALIYSPGHFPREVFGAGGLGGGGLAPTALRMRFVDDGEGSSTGVALVRFRESPEQVREWARILLEQLERDQIPFEISDQERGSELRIGFGYPLNELLTEDEELLATGLNMELNSPRLERAFGRGFAEIAALQLNHIQSRSEESASQWVVSFGASAMAPAALRPMAVEPRTADEKSCREKILSMSEGLYSRLVWLRPGESSEYILEPFDEAARDCASSLPEMAAEMTFVRARTRFIIARYLQSSLGYVRQLVGQCRQGEDGSCEELIMVSEEFFDEPTTNMGSLVDEPQRLFTEACELGEAAACTALERLPTVEEMTL